MIKHLKKALFGGLAALILTTGINCNKFGPNQPEPDQPKIAVKLLQDNRVSINPAIVRSLDATKTLWLASDSDEYLSLFEEEPQYQELKPASRCSLIRSDWYETQVPIAGQEFTIIQFDESGKRKWAQYGCLALEGIVMSRSGGKCLELPKGGFPASMYGHWIKLDSTSSGSYLTLTKDILPVDTSQLTKKWKLVGDWNGWDYESGLSPTSFTSQEIEFDVSGIHGKVNVKATSKMNTSIWGRFGHLGTGELDGYRHSLIKYDGNSAAIFIP